MISELSLIVQIAKYSLSLLQPCFFASVVSLRIPLCCVLPPSGFMPFPHALAESLICSLPFGSLQLWTKQFQGAKLRRTSSCLPLNALIRSSCPNTDASFVLTPFHCQMHVSSLGCSTSTSACFSRELHQQKAVCHESRVLAVLHISPCSGVSRGAALQVRPLGQRFLLLQLQITA